MLGTSGQKGIKISGAFEAELEIKGEFVARVE
jgi:hypothetical protein